MMLSQSKIEEIAKRLFPDDVSSMADCQGEIGRVGQPCRVCQDNNRVWSERLDQVKMVLTEVLELDHGEVVDKTSDPAL
jgi:hypothetical protein